MSKTEKKIKRGASDKISDQHFSKLKLIKTSLRKYQPIGNQKDPQLNVTWYPVWDQDPRTKKKKKEKKTKLKTKEI